MLLPEMPPHIEFRYRLNVQYDAWMTATFDSARRFSGPSRYLVPRYVFKHGEVVENEECVIVTKMTNGNEINILFWDELDLKIHDLHVPMSWMHLLEEEHCDLDLKLRRTNPPMPAYCSYIFGVYLPKYELSEFIR